MYKVIGCFIYISKYRFNITDIAYSSTWKWRGLEKWWEFGMRKTEEMIDGRWWVMGRLVTGRRWGWWHLTELDVGLLVGVWTVAEMCVKADVVYDVLFQAAGSRSGEVRGKVTQMVCDEGSGTGKEAGWGDRRLVGDGATRDEGASTRFGSTEHCEMVALATVGGWRSTWELWKRKKEIA